MRLVRHFAMCALAGLAPVAASAQTAPASHLVVSPTVRTVVAGDSLQLRGQLLDAAGAPVTGAHVTFRSAGGYYDSAYTLNMRFD